jgi:hypothetical protein
MKDLVYSIPIDTIEVLGKRVENAAITIRNNSGRTSMQNDGQLFFKRLPILLKLTLFIEDFFPSMSKNLTLMQYSI